VVPLKTWNGLFLFTAETVQLLEDVQLCVIWVPVALLPGIKWPERKSHYLNTTNVQIIKCDKCRLIYSVTKYDVLLRSIHSKVF
jgi:hypothetical protein